MDSLKNHIAVVTGASSGIGKTLALSLAAQGVEVYLLGRRKEILEEVAKRAQRFGSRSHVCPVDLTRDEDIRALSETRPREEQWPSSSFVVVKTARRSVGTMLRFLQGL